MRKILTVIILSFTVLALPSLGQASAPEKIGFVNFSLALQTIDEARTEIEGIKVYRDQKQQESDARFAEVKKFRDDMAAKATTLNADALAAAQRELEDKEVELKRFQEDTQKDIDSRRDSVLRKFGQKLQTVINEYCEQNSFGVLFLLDQAQYAYVDPALDMTTQIVGLYNQRHPAAQSVSSPPSN